MSANAIHAARDQLLAFFVQAYHLKDSLSQASGIDRGGLECAITKEPDLALLADLANLDKHGRLTRPPRSGSVPRVDDSVSGIQDGAGREGWRLGVTLHHGGRRIDGLAFANAVVDAWRRHLS